MNYDDWKTDPDLGRWHGQPSTIERPCIKCERPCIVSYDYIGRPWCDRCVLIDKLAVSALVASRKAG